MPAQSIQSSNLSRPSETPTFSTQSGGFRTLGSTDKFAESVSPFSSETKARINADEHKTGVNQTLQAIRSRFTLHLHAALLVLLTSPTIIVPERQQRGRFLNGSFCAATCKSGQ
jgi:hypothetical protein